MAYPNIRTRRLRTSRPIRDLVRENHLSAADFLVPLFVVEGKGVKDEIVSMPGYFRFSLDTLKEELRELYNLGLRSVLLFAKVPDNLKDNQGKEALNGDGLLPRAIKTVKDQYPDMLVMTDVALDPFSIYGHDGIIEKGVVHNDKTIEVLAQMSVVHAQAGADFVAPSDMMDGRIAAIRQALEQENLFHTGILSYTAKYASGFYGPFRDALDSAPSGESGIPKDKGTYQMDPSNAREAIREAELDIAEGADIIMVKPGISYLDIIKILHDRFNVPIAAYQVSGEYAMLKAAAQKGWLDHDTVMMEQLLAFKRAGTQVIATYFAKDAVKLLGNM